MSNISLTLETRCFDGRMGDELLSFDVVTGLQLPRSAPQHFNHYMLPGEGTDTTQILLPESMALRLAEFGKVHQVEGRGNFDCRAFLGYVASWDDSVRTNVTRWYHGVNVNLTETKPAQPYVIIDRDFTVPHAMLGTDTPGESISAAGYELGLIIARNDVLMRVFGGVALREVSHIEDV